MALAFAPFGKEMTVEKINLDEGTRRHLNNLGLVVGSTVTVVSVSGGSVIMRVKDSKVAVNQGLAMKIMVA